MKNQLMKQIAYLNDWLSQSLFKQNRVNFIEGPNKLIAEIEIPSLTSDHQLDVEVVNNHLVVQGKLIKETEVSDEKRNSYYEYNSEFFYQAIPITKKVLPKNHKIRYDKGMLYVEMIKHKY